MRAFALITCFLGAVWGCTGSNGGGAPGVTDGTYRISANVSADQCGYDLAGLHEATLPVTALDTRVIAGSWDLLRDEDQLSLTEEESVDWRPTFQCIQRDRAIFAGTITGPDRFELDATWTWVSLLGTTGCTLATSPVVLPCESHALLQFDKL